MQHRSLLPTWDLQGKRVLVRADLNVPISDGKPTDDFRLRALIPTIRMIQQLGGKPIIITHIGRPKDHEEALSTKHLVPWFIAHGIATDFAPDLATALEKSNESNGDLVLLENLRFFPGEKENDAHFAQELAQLGDYFVQDAFGSLHRADASIVSVPAYFHGAATIGILVEHELAQLSRLLGTPARPYVVILGGAKVQSKLPLIKEMLTHADTLLLCPAIVFTFLYAQHRAVGRSLVEKSLADECHLILEHARALDVEIIFPEDYVIAHHDKNGALSTVAADAIPADGFGMSIGPATLTLFENYISNAGTIFFNGTMGFADRPETQTATCHLMRAMADSSAFSVVAGGDSVAAAYHCGVAASMQHLSSGGGAALTLLSGEPLPGLTALQH